MYVLRLGKSGGGGGGNVAKWKNSSWRPRSTTIMGSVFSAGKFEASRNRLINLDNSVSQKIILTALQTIDP